MAASPSIDYTFVNFEFWIKTTGTTIYPTRINVLSQNTHSHTQRKDCQTKFKEIEQRPKEVLPLAWKVIHKGVSYFK